MTIDEIKPFGDRILVRPDPKIETSEGGLHIPPTVLADNPNYFTVSGTVVKLGDGYREDVWECQNQQCRYQARRTQGEYCPLCKATQKLAYADSGVHQFDLKVGDRVLFGRFAGRQIEITEDGMPLGIQKPRVLLMREIEVLGVLDDADARVLPGYQAPKVGKASSGLTADDGRGIIEVK